VRDARRIFSSTSSFHAAASCICVRPVHRILELTLARRLARFVACTAELYSLQVKIQSNDTGYPHCQMESKIPGLRSGNRPELPFSAGRGIPTRSKGLLSGKDPLTPDTADPNKMLSTPRNQQVARHSNSRSQIDAPHGNTILSERMTPVSSVHAQHVALSRACCDAKCSYHVTNLGIVLSSCLGTHFLLAWSG
jgi:hypothetical protein